MTSYSDIRAIEGFLTSLEGVLLQAMQEMQNGIIQELRTMSATLGQQLTDAETTLANDLAAQTTAIGAETAAITALIAAFQNVAAGDVVTPAMLAAIQAADAALNVNTGTITQNVSVEQSATNPTPPVPPASA